jgi:hypothetical protein
MKQIIIVTLRGRRLLELYQHSPAYLHKGFSGLLAHKSLILSQPIETAFRPDMVQNFSGTGIQIIIPDAASQQADNVHNEPQTAYPRPKSLVALNPVVASLLPLCAVKTSLSQTVKLEFTPDEQFWGRKELNISIGWGGGQIDVKACKIRLKVV